MELILQTRIKIFLQDNLSDWRFGWRKFYVGLHVIRKLEKDISLDGLQINIDKISRGHDHVCVFDSNSASNSSEYLTSSKIIAIGSVRELTIDHPKNALKQLQQFYDVKKSWLFGYITYDLKNEIEHLSSENIDQLRFPALHFFEPRTIIRIEEKKTELIFNDEFVTENEAQEIYADCFSKPEIPLVKNSEKLHITSRISKNEYIASVERLKSHIRNGDIYELNYCQEFFAENADIDPSFIHQRLNSISEAPFTAYCKFGKRYVMCASPERFLRRTGNRLISQPIKGTIKRSPNEQEDAELRKQLKNDIKERSENVMIVDLVRNDLSRIAKRGTVKTDELFGIYSFKQVHQMISTVSCEIPPTTSFTDILKSTFPMGSMTGAPKVSAMKLIEQYEKTKRGLYSGAIGFIDPDGDFDLNVVIRSILYNSENKYLSFMVGSAITDRSIAEKEYDECMLKAKAMFEVLTTNY